MKPYVISVMGTRGKSSFIRNFHRIFLESGFKVLSRETGLFPVIRENEKTYYANRKNSVPLSRSLEPKVLLEKHFKKDSYDIILFENNSISEGFMRNFHNYLKPDLVIILTLTPDHVQETGYRASEILQVYLKTVPKNSKVLLWTNHKKEIEELEKELGKEKQRVKVLFSSFEKRDITIAKEIEKILGVRFAHKEAKNNEEKDIVKHFGNESLIVNFGHINDPIHTLIALERFSHKFEGKKLYLILNSRPDRIDRTFIFLNALMPTLKHEVKELWIVSESWFYSGDDIKKWLNSSAREKVGKIRALSFRKMAERVEHLARKENNLFLIIGNTADWKGFRIISRYGFFKNEYKGLSIFLNSEKEKNR